MKATLSTLLILLFSLSAQAQYKVHTVAFYNLENLFDTIRNEEINDASYTPQGDVGWNTMKYNNKLENMSKVLAEIGTSEQMKLPPAIIGVCEIENREVLEDLVAMPALKPYNYEIVHKHSPDERGIDVALLYQKDLFELDSYKAFKTHLPDEDDSTRDILLVTGNLDGERIHFTVNHWPSRSGGEKISMPNRFAAAENLRAIIDSIQMDDEHAKIISMGDFNDDPISPSMAKVLGATGKKGKLKSPKDLYNPYWDFYKKGYGTTAYRDAWSLFDMLVVTNSLLETDEDQFRMIRADRYTPDYLIQDRGQFRGYPKRTHSFGKYLNGYSDHFPVYLYLAKKVVKKEIQN